MCAVLGWVGTKSHSIGIRHYPRDLVGWEQRDIVSVGTNRMEMERGHLLWYGHGLDGYGNCDTSRDRSYSPFPWKYRGKSTAGIFPRGALQKNYYYGKYFERLVLSLTGISDAENKKHPLWDQKSSLFLGYEIVEARNQRIW